MRITLLGDGGWGTALACVLVRNGHGTTLWGSFPDVTAGMRRNGENVKFLPGIRLPAELELSNDLEAAVASADLVVFSTPVVYLREVAEHATPFIKARPGLRVMSVAKGIERESLLRGCEVLQQVLEIEDVGMLFGPSHAEEVAKRMPTTIVAAAKDEAFAELIQQAFMNDRFRVYTSTDVIGVEIGADVKNVIAIAAGICDGLQLGDNAKAALLTRGLAEIARLGEAMGARPETFAGLSGLGDLITTCFSPYGRNRRIGLEIGQGKTVDRALEDMKPMVPEGIYTTRSVCALATRERVEMPISRAVHNVLFGAMSPADAVRGLMNRDPKPE